MLRPWPAFFTLFALLALAAPASGSGEARISAHAEPSSRTENRIRLYSPRVRRSTVMYLRLRLLELREAGLDRARAAIERRLRIDDLLAEPAYDTEDARSRPRRSQPAPHEKASEKSEDPRTRRTVGP